MQEPLFPGCRKGSFPFVTDAALCMVNTDDPNADRIATPTLELDSLITEIVDDAIYPLDHGFR